MITVNEAHTLILQNTSLAETTLLEIDRLSNEVLREPFIADRCHPPFDRVAMDGIAINYDAYEKGQIAFSVKGYQQAGAMKQSLTDTSGCFEVMTGAILPEGCNAVIRYEDVNIENGTAHLKDGLTVDIQQNIHLKGSDYSEGEGLASENQVLLAPHWSVAATIGKSQVLISNRPQIAVISTGDELIRVDDLPLEHQIRESNCYALLASLKALGHSNVELLKLGDDKEELYYHLKELLDTKDILILSGGVSMGKFDFIPQVLTDLNVKKIFHKVRQRPGKPLWFGVGPRKQMVFGLPGNPVSSLICLHRYVLPALRRYLGLEKSALRDTLYAKLGEEVVFNKALTYFLPVKVNFTRAGSVTADPVNVNGSGDLAALVHSDGFIELDAEKKKFIAGESYPLFLWKEVF